MLSQFCRTIKDARAGTNRSPIYLGLGRFSSGGRATVLMLFLAFLLQPLQRSLTRRLGGAGLAAGLITGLTPIAIIAPLLLIGFAFAQQVSGVAQEDAEIEARGELRAEQQARAPARREASRRPQTCSPRWSSSGLPA